jgi:hypothetical protein
MSLPEPVSLSLQAEGLAAAIGEAMAEDRLEALSPEAVQALTAALCRLFAAKREAGEDFLPLRDRHSASNTDVMVMASGLLRAADLAVFELGMWQNMTGR